MQARAFILAPLLLIINTPNQSLFSVFSSHLLPAQEAYCAPHQSLHYVSNTSSHTLLVCMDVISLNMQPNFEGDTSCFSRVVLWARFLDADEHHWRSFYSGSVLLTHSAACWQDCSITPWDLLVLSPSVLVLTILTWHLHFYMNIGIKLQNAN